MKRKPLCLILAAAVCLALGMTALAATNSFGNFSRQRTYDGRFADVSGDAWYADAVKLGYEYGFIHGMSATAFAPSNNLSVAEAITLACRIHSIYTTGSDPGLSAEAGDRWYSPYVRYAAANGIISDAYGDYDVPAVRSEAAAIFAKALPPEALTAIRVVEDDAIPDVPSSAAYAEPVYLLYRAGVLSGNDEYGTFSPDSHIRRSEISAICVRLAVPSERSAKALAAKASEDAKLNAAISAVLREQYRSKDPDGLIHVQSYYLLADETTEAGSEGGFGERTVYLIVYHMIYRMGEKPEELEGGFVPAVITFSADKDGAYSLKVYWTPGEGANYESDIRARFPAAAAEEALRIERYADYLKKDNWNQLTEYLNRLNGDD